MRAHLSWLCAVALGAGCAQTQKDLEKGASYGAGQAQGRVDQQTGQSTTQAQKAGADAAKRVDGDPAPPPDATARPLGVSEAEFKALHEHTAAEAPAPKGEMIEVGGARAYLSLPEGATAPVPGVVVIHEWWGLNPHIQHWADRLAAEGYAALAVDLYGGETATESEQAMTLMKAVDPQAAHKILAAAYDFLGSDPRVKATKRASIGWCFGGGWSLKLALAKPLDAAVVYYGRLVTDPEALTKIDGKLLGVFGNQDQGIPPKDVDAFEAGLKEAGVDAKILRYDAQHAFANPSSARYDAASAEQAWAEVQAFLRAELGGAK